MTIFDPCNRVLTLIQDPEKDIFYVNPISHQKLTNEKILQYGTKDNLILYEIKNETKIWSPSTRFTGVLSNNFIERIELRITSHSTEEIPGKKITMKRSKWM